MKTIVDLTEELKEYSLEKDTAAKQAVEANIAPVEADASSASRTYVVGEQLFLNDVLYDVTSPISVGDAIAVGTNITAANKLSADIQTLTSALTKYVNEYGSKNLCPYEDTLSVPTTNTAGQLLASVELKAGDKITFVCTQDNAMTSNVRNTLIIDNPSGVRSVQSSATNNHLSAGLHVMEYTATESGVHKFGIWANTISTATTYSKFMICHTDVYNVSPDYVPYSKTNRQLTEDSVTWDVLSEVGAVNDLENKGTTQVDATTGLTFTVNDDKSVTVSATSGTYPHTVPSAKSFIFNSDSCDNLKDGKVYRLSGCPSSGSSSSYYIAFYQSGVVDKSDQGNGYVFAKTASMTSVLTQISIKANAVLSSAITFYPMIAPVDYNGPYVPYAKTNRELTDDVGNLFVVSSRAGNVFDITISGGYGGNDGTRALIFGSTFIGLLNYYSNQWNYTGSIATKEGQSISQSNNSSTGLRLTLGGSADSLNIVPINLGSSHFKITFVS